MNKLVLVAFVLVLAAPGCFLFGQPKHRTDCWDVAGKRAKARIAKECEPDQTMAECPAWPDIEAELKADQESCR